jgi:triosephosphate isomerase
MAGNWKMHMTRTETRDYLRAFVPETVGVDDRDILVCTPFTSLETALAEAAGSNVAVGAQSMHFAERGAFTGEVSAAMLVELGVPWVILGHSERRQYFGETDDDLARKLPAAFSAGLRPILCIGETLAEREGGATEERLAAQLTADLAGLADEQVAALAVAYEPIWAIGTGRQATPEVAQETIAFVRRRLAAHSPSGAGARILYGGSVKASTIDELMAQPDIDGVLVGGASLDPNEFARIVRFLPV